MIKVEAGDITLDNAAMRDLMEGRGGPVVRSLVKGGTAVAGMARVELSAKRIGRNGDLAQMIDNEVLVQSGRVTVNVVSKARTKTGVPYGKWVHEGTNGPIRPRNKRVLRFQSRGGAFVFAPQVRGTKQTGRFTPFLADALARLRMSDFI
jgi:hypothetical protein